MSSTVLKQSLELFEEEQFIYQGKKNQCNPQTKKVGVKKKSKHHKMKPHPHSSIKKRSQIGSVIEEYNLMNQGDNTDDNLYRLKRISEMGKLDSSLTKKILDHNKKKSTKHQECTKRSREEQVFTDRDFEKFEEEYDFFS